MQKQPDVTVLLRVKGSAPPSATALFRTQLNFALFPDQEWHWAIVRAKGVPPQIPPDAATMQLVQGAGQLSPAAPDAGVPVAPPIPSSSESIVIESEWHGRTNRFHHQSRLTSRVKLTTNSASRTGDEIWSHHLSRFQL